MVPPAPRLLGRVGAHMGKGQRRKAQSPPPEGGGKGRGRHVEHSARALRRHGRAVEAGVIDGEASPPRTRSCTSRSARRGKVMAAKGSRYTSLTRCTRTRPFHPGRTVHRDVHGGIRTATRSTAPAPRKATSPHRGPPHRYSRHRARRNSDNAATRKSPDHKPPGTRHVPEQDARDGAPGELGELRH